MTLLDNLHFCGLLLVALAALHFVFPKRFTWSDEFKSVSLLSRQMFYVHTWFIALVVLLNGLLFLFLAPDLLEGTRISQALLGGIAGFWFARLLVQLFVYSPLLWRGKKFETRVNLVLTILWAYLTTTAATALLHAFQG